MKIAFHNMYSELDELLFVERNAPIGDDLLLPFVRLKEEADRRGIEVTAKPASDADAIVFIDWPRPDGNDFVAAASSAKLYLITFENPLIYSPNGQNWHLMKKVFTWDDRAVALRSEQCVKINYPQEFPQELPPAEPRKLLTMIASNKGGAVLLGSLYAERNAAVTWFERNARDKLDVYGPGWEHSVLSHGRVPAGAKRGTLAGYKFALCYENAAFEGYVTEKIFDCFSAGTIPIYLGAPNVDRHIPRECYIDARGFFGDYRASVANVVDYAKLLWHLERLSSGVYARRLDAIRRFIRSPQAEAFSCARFAKTILDTVAGETT